MSIHNKKMNLTARLLLFGIGLTFISCIGNIKNNSDKSDEDVVDTPLGITIKEPVQRDLSEIKNSGVLRMITSYSSNSYFLYRGVQAGFEYELIQNFARENDLALEVIIVGEHDNPYDLLNKGDGDIIANNYTVTKERSKVVQFTRPYNLVDQIVVFSDELKNTPQNLEDLGDLELVLRRNSSYYARLKELENEGLKFNIKLLSDDLDTEAILFMVSSGIYDATIADDNMFEASNLYMDGLLPGPTIATGDSVAWAIRKNASDLEGKLNSYLKKHFRFSEDGEPKRSEFLNVLRKRYFEGGGRVATYFKPLLESNDLGMISPYDSLIQVVSKEFDLDWIMLTSIVAQESEFNSFSESWAGAVGLMQIMPRFSEIHIDSLYIPEINIREGAKILREHLNHYAYMDTTNQWKFALATYNAGMGHIADARRLAIDHNEDPNEWDNIAKALIRLMQRKYYQNARYGFSRGIETVQYVNEITNRTNTYMAILALSKGQNTMIPKVLGIKSVN